MESEAMKYNPEIDLIIIAIFGACCVVVALVMAVRKDRKGRRR